MSTSGFEPGAPCWAQLSTSDMDAAKRFYGELFGWTAETDPSPEAGGYTMFNLDGKPAAACAPLMNPQQPVMWLLSFNTPEIDKTTEAATAAGAKVWMGPMDVMDVGRWALLNDPAGAPFSFWQAKGFAGFGAMDEPNSFGWIDGASRDVKASLEFYTTVLGWKVWQDEEYPMVGFGEKMFGGLMAMGDMFPADVPSHWNPYFVVTDVDATANKAAKLGGELLHGPEETPMENGPRIAVVRDPQGAMFGIFKPPAQ